MDFLLDNHSLMQWLTNYGPFALFFLLTVGIVILPVPEETMMIVAGIMMSKGHLHIPSIIIACYAGSICGITVSYFIGYLTGDYFVTLCAKWSKTAHKKYHKAQEWFAYMGKWTLTIGYFIPGVRHFTGLSAGVVKLPYRTFALYAYSGAIVWASIFLSIGMYLSDYWVYLIEQISIYTEYTDHILLAIGLIAICSLVIFWKRQVNKNT